MAGLLLLKCFVPLTEHDFIKCIDLHFRLYFIFLRNILTFCQTIPTFNDLRKEILQKQSYHFHTNPIIERMFISLVQVYYFPVLVRVNSCRLSR